MEWLVITNETFLRFQAKVKKQESIVQVFQIEWQNDRKRDI